MPNERLYFDSDKLEELRREISTSPVDGEGHTTPVQFTEQFVRGTILKLIHDVKLMSSQNEELKEWGATVINSYHHVMTYDITQIGVQLIKGDDPDAK